MKIQNKAKERFEKRVEETNEYILLDEYRGYNKKVKIKHLVCGIITEYTPEKFNGGSRCKECFVNGLRKDKEFVEHIRSVGNYELLSKYVNNKTKVTLKHHDCGTIFEITPSKFTNRKVYCPCVRKHKKWTKKRFEKEMEEKSGTKYKLESPFKDIYSKVDIKHITCGKTFNTTARNMVETGGCPFCRGSNGEIMVSDILDKLGIRYIREYREHECKHKIKLSFDFYLPDYNTFIEYQGSQHYHHSPSFQTKKSFEEAQLRDKIKREYCKDEKIKLLEIPYWIVSSGIEKRILECINRNNI